MSDRTKGERRLDELNAEARELRAVDKPTSAQKMRLADLSLRLIPSARRAVWGVREQVKQRRLL